MYQDSTVNHWRTVTSTVTINVSEDGEEITVTGTKPTSEKVSQSCTNMYITVTAVTFSNVTYWE